LRELGIAGYVWESRLFGSGSVFVESGAGVPKFQDRMVRMLVLVSLLALFPGWTPPTGAEETEKPEEVASPKPNYHIGAGDVLEVSVWKNDQLTRTVTVRPDGMISLPLLNDVQAAGLTPL